MNSKRTIMILILVLTIGIVGLTIAYFANSTSVDNVFTTQPYGTTVTENFTSPSNWLPGDTTNKTVVATNSGNVDEAVRISLSESWVTANHGTLNGWITENGNKSSHLPENEPSTDERVAVINFDNASDWTYNNGYYYYNYKLAPNESTSSLIKSVTFNSKTKLDDTCVETPTATGRTITCNSSGDDYDDATYTLTFNIETIQYNKYKEAWGTELAIASEQTLFCDVFKVGEVVTYNDVDYYVLKESNTSDDYVTLLKKDPLTAEEVNLYSTKYVSQNGEYPYFESDACNQNSQIGCSTNYNTSSVKKIVDGWSSNFNNNLVEIDGYKSRLISENDFNFSKSVTPSNISYEYDSDIPAFIKDEVAYWSLIKSGDSNKIVVGINQYNPYEYNIYNKIYIRPIINLKKNFINGACSYTNVNNCDINNFNHKSYSIGDIVTYKNNNYYVIENSGQDKNYVTLLKSDPLTYNDISPSKYTGNNNIATTEYFYNQYTCNYFTNNTSGCTTNYNESNIKNVVDSWTSRYINNLVEINGYKARLITVDELQDNLNYTYEMIVTAMGYNPTESTPNWAYSSEYSYWTMSIFEDSNYDVYVNTKDSINHVIVSGSAAIRPVINLKKCAISD